jgi:ribonuclease VapC
LGSVIFIDTSAIVAILTFEEDADRLLEVMRSAGGRNTGAHVRLECAINLTRVLKIDVQKAELLFDGLLQMASIDVVSVDDEISKAAVTAFGRYGKGRGHPAQLNFGDCLSYACASMLDAAILFKGRDFMHTDLKIA